MSFDEYVKAVQSTRDGNPDWRQGQAYFNVLYVERPDLSEQIRGTALDPFHKSGDALRAFLTWANANWEAGE